MLKNIFLALLAFSPLAVAFHAAANPIDLFSHQCITYAPKINGHHFSTQKTYTPSVYQLKLTQFDQHLLGLNNLKDRLLYYRSLNLSSQQRQLLLQCQIHISDSLNQLINTHADFLKSPVLSQVPLRYQNAANTLLKQRLTQQQVQQKSSRLVAQTIYQQAFKQYKAIIKINDIACQLNNKARLSTTQDVARYLMFQPLSRCRKPVWLQYQLRTKQDNLASLEYLWDHFNHDAKKSGFQNDTDLQLAKISLTKQQALAFINAKSQHLSTEQTVTPWNMASALHQNKANSPHLHNPVNIDSHAFVLSAIDALTEIGLRFELIPTDEHKQNRQSHFELAQPFVYRIWHKSRLLGQLDVFINDNITKPQGSLIRKTIIGQQYGQWVISLPTKELTGTNQRKFISLLSQSMTSLAQAHWLYTTSVQEQSQLSFGIGKLWLESYLHHNTRLYNDSGIYKQTRQFKQSWQLYRAQLAIEFYSLKRLDWQSPEYQQFQQAMADSFYDIFGEKWIDASESLFTFGSLASQRALIILPQWQQALATLITKQHRRGLTNQQIFDLLIINSSGKSVSQQLSVLLHGKTDTNTLIRRIANAN
ncbi:hypothetical protein ACFOD0_01975 [Shewanella intestini]|uniref:Uncharacterized protein n=1 Tax=Shewanella intestini TaxID=2017544 RepID=A0ABS5I1H6_9GAMM|nr:MULTISPECIES: hypothetical protein [Shewanella]MBR9727875.1 hypothetical protein [Shewanella intestini]MRG36132.1 hypothetical protein [Shewanella sp. XMDDZSB0408]